MDYEKYYKMDPDGLYSLHFMNKDHLDTTDVKKIFSRYGNVLSVRIIDAGLTFVKFKTLKEIISCWKGLKDSNEIQLLLERSKMSNFDKKTDKRHPNQQQAERTGNSFNKISNSNWNKQLDSKFIRDKDSPKIEENSTHIRTSNGNNGPNKHLDTNFQSSMPKCNPSIMRDNELDSSESHEKSSLISRQTSTETNSSNITTDYEKYYRILKDGTCTVHFINRKGLSIEDINGLFSPYGNVLSIYSGGKRNELKFIRYKTLEEVVRCLKGLQNSDIYILPQKYKVIDETKTIDQENSQDTSQRISSTNQQFDWNSIHNEGCSENREKPIHNTETSKREEDTGHFSDISYGSRQHCESNGTKYELDPSPSTSNEKKRPYLKLNPMNNKGYNHVMREKQQETKYPLINTETDIKVDRNLRTSTYEHKIPALISNIETKSNESDVMSDSFSSDKIKNSSSKTTVVPMQEIIVANIHGKYGVHYILHLFEKHDPISATLVKTISKNDIRYCHVYFKTVQDTVAVEKEFDNFNLSGQKLIVLRKITIDKIMCK